MNITIHKPEDPLMLKHALLIYENTQERVIQRATVEVQDGRAVLTRPEQITDSLAAMLAQTRYSPLTFIPPQVIGVTKDACAWYVPAQSRPLFFDPTRDVSLKDLSGQFFPQPPLLMISGKNELKVYALKDDVRPGPDTPLMNAPYYNIFDSDSVCLGTSYRPFDGSLAYLHEWEASFYGSHFTHRAGSTLRWINDRTHRELWEGAAAAGRFDPAWLIPAKKTLQSLLGRGA